MDQHTKQYQINRVWVKVLCMMAFLLMGPTISASPRNNAQQPTKAAKVIKKIRSNITWRGSGMFAASVAVNGLAVILIRLYIGYSKNHNLWLSNQASVSKFIVDISTLFMKAASEELHDWAFCPVILAITALSWLVVKGVSWIVKQYGSPATHFLTRPWVEAIEVLLIVIVISRV